MSYTVHKRDHTGELVLTYEGELIERDAEHVVLRASFQLSTRDLGYLYLKQGDIFTEWFYSKRWFNVFRVEDVDSGEVKGYYCNLTRPAQIHDDYVTADDLALDVFVKPDGETLLLDEDDYNSLPLSDDERHQVQQAVQTIDDWIARRYGPFADLQP